MRWTRFAHLAVAIAATGCGSATNAGSGESGGLVCEGCAEIDGGAYGLDFAHALVGQRVSRKIAFRNTAKNPLTFVVPTPALPFGCPTCGARTLDPGSTTSLTFTFSPDQSGSSSQDLAMEGPGGKPITLKLSGIAVTHYLAIEPGGDCFDFGGQTAGVPVSNEFRVKNQSSRVVKILSVDTTGGGVFTVDSGGLASLAPAGEPGDSAVLRVTFNPPADGAREGLLRVVADQDAGGLLQQCLRGSATPPPACTAVLDPPDGKLVLGAIPPGDSTSAAFTVQNTSAGPCQVGPISLVGGAGSSFTLDPTSEQVVEIGPGGSLDVPVQFRPALAGTYNDSIVVKVAGHPDLRVSLRGVAALPCLRFDDVLDFGVIAPECRTQARYLQLENRCDEPVRVDRLAVRDGNGFALEATDLPLLLVPGAHGELGVTFRPAADAPSEVSGELLITTDELPEPWHVRLEGAVHDTPHQFDRFTHRTPQNDVLLVLDPRALEAIGGGSLAADPVRDGFLALARERHHDFQIGVTASNVGDGCALDGRLRPLEGERFMNADNVDDLWTTRLAPLACDVAPEQLLEAAMRAVTSPVADHADDPRHAEPDDGNLGFLRRDATLAIVLVTGQDDGSPLDVPQYLQKLRGTKSTRRANGVSVHALFRPPGAPCTGEEVEGVRIAQAVQQTGGSGASICSPGMVDPMALLGQAVFSAEQCHELTGVPTGSGSSDGWLRVLVNGKEVKAVGNDGDRRWAFRPGPNALCFTVDAAPAPGAEVRVDYAVACGK